MIKELIGYSIKEELYLGDKSIVYKAMKGIQPVIIKYLNEEYPSPEALNHFKKEHEILNRIKSELVIKSLSFEKCNNSYLIVFEDILGSSLSKLLEKNEKFSIKDFLEISILSVQALNELHNENIIHKDIKPHNIIYNENTKQLRIIDLGSASLLSKENPTLNMKQNMEGTLAYISPEQTGRMNRNIDYRTDFYSLGITFYQLLTGKLPFISEDPSELIHKHITTIPETPNFIDSSIPKPISKVIMKLIEKSPENRYQSLSGLLFDLNEIQLKIENNQDVNDFNIGQKDNFGYFQIPEKLYGRKTEIEKLLSNFKTATNGNLKVMIVSGLSGIGKTALINEIQKSIVEYKGHFISGKFDKFKRNMPYRGIIYTFKDLVEQILKEPTSVIKEWRNKILASVGTNGKVLTDIIPELESIIGTQPLVMELGPTESQNRFNLVFQDFLNVFCTESHPMAIFLDDLQWADQASLDLLNNILSNQNNKYLYFIFSYRSNEVDAVHPFSVLLEDTKKIGLSYEEIQLEPFQIEDTNQLIADTLHCNLDESKPLAKLIHSKTGGNPFFTNELFKTLYKDNYIRFENKWIWEIEKIQTVSVSTNVIDLMVQKINKLSLDKIKLLKIGACMGNWFYPEILQQIYNINADNFQELLTSIANDGYFLVSEIEVKFTHDKIRESIYTIITEEERQEYHYKIGKIYLDLCEKQIYSIDDYIFTVVNQLNQGTKFLTSEDKNKLLDLNILAGKKSLASAAYQASVEYLKNAETLLPENSWSIDYNKTLDIFTQRAKAEYLSTNLEEAEIYFNTILEKANSILEKVVVFELKIAMYATQNNHSEAIKMGKNALELLGVTISEKFDFVEELTRVNNNINGRQIYDLEHIQMLEEPKLFAAMSILAACISPSYIAQPDLLPFVIMKMVNITLENGISVFSIFGFIFYGNILGSALGNYKAGYEFAKLALKLLDKFNIPMLRSKIWFIHGTMINHWNTHAKEDLSFLKGAMESGINFGDLEFGTYAINHYSNHCFLTRMNLSELRDVLNTYRDTQYKLRQSNSIINFSIWDQLVDNLLGDVEHLHTMIGKRCNLPKIIEYLKSVNDLNSLTVSYLSLSILSYVYGDYSQSYLYSVETEQYLGGVFGMMMNTEHNFFYSLSCLAQYSNEIDPNTKSKYIEQVKKNQEKMKVWSENCPDNYSHKYYIIEGELAVVSSDMIGAIENFDKAIKLSRKYEYILEEAIANELYAKFWINRGNEKYAKMNLIEAHYTYQKWGCKPKVKILEEKFPFLKRQIDRMGKSRSNDATISSNALTMTRTSTGSSSGDMLDFETVLKASQTLSSEIEFDKLMNKMMKILFENAGAQEGTFIQVDKNKNTNEFMLTIQAKGNYKDVQIQSMMNEPVEKANLPQTIINFTANLKREVVLDDASNKGDFIRDPYILEKKPKSVVSFPIILQGKLYGLVYLENNATTHAFTRERLEILKVLSSQIAISLENVRLLEQVVSVTAEKTRVSTAMEIAKDIQTCLLPPEPAIKGYDISAYMLTCDEVGGDYYDIINEEARDWLVIGDVSGHGVKSGLIMMMVQVALHTAIQFYDSNTNMETTLQVVNKVISNNIKMMKADKYMTINLFLHKEHTFYYAGLHQPILVYRSATKEIEKTENEGAWLGYLEFMNEYPISQMEMNVGDILILFTDGVTEGVDEKGKMFDDAGLADFLKQNGDKTSSEIKQNLLEELKKYKNEDDITFMIVKRYE